MSKEPIDLGLSVERHVHHEESDHSHDSPEDQLSNTRRDDRQFGTESLSQIEQILMVLFVGAIFVIFLTIIISVLINSL